MNEEILARFAQLAGMTAEEAERWLPICLAASAEIRARVKPAVLTAAQRELLCAAGAALAFYRYSLTSCAMQEESFAAGDVKVRRGNSGYQAAKRLWEEMKTAAAPLLTDDDFLFRQVRP